MTAAQPPGGTGKASTIPFIEAIRAIAPLLVMWAHLGRAWCLANPEACHAANDWRLLGTLDAAAQRLGIYDSGAHLGVLLFFLVSGFIISHVATAERRREFVIKRAFRIAPMLLAGVALTYAVSSALVRADLPPTLAFGARSLADLILSMFLLDWFLPIPFTTPVTWSLVTEVVFYVLMITAYPLLARRPVLSTLALIAAVAAMAGASGGSLPAFFMAQIEFILVGRAVYLVWSGAATYRAALLLGAAALAALTALYMLTPYSRSLFFTAGSVVYAWVIALALFGLAVALIRRSLRPLRFLSDISYSVYMLHLPIGALVLNVLTLGYGVWIGWSFWLAGAAVLACSSLTHAWIEVPFQRLGRKLLQHRLGSNSGAFSAAEGGTAP